MDFQSFPHLQEETKSSACTICKWKANGKSLAAWTQRKPALVLRTETAGPNSQAFICERRGAVMRVLPSSVLATNLRHQLRLVEKSPMAAPVSCLPQRVASSEPGRKGPLGASGKTKDMRTATISEQKQAGPMRHDPLFASLQATKLQRFLT